MKNYMEQFRLGLVSGADDYTAAKTLTADTSVKVLKSKLYDTSSDANAFASLTVGTYVKMTGWDSGKEENNGIFRLTAKGLVGTKVNFTWLGTITDKMSDCNPEPEVTLTSTSAGMQINVVWDE